MNLRASGNQTCLFTSIVSGAARSYNIKGA
jgi:hypothetical protein